MSIMADHRERFISERSVVSAFRSQSIPTAALDFVCHPSRSGWKVQETPPTAVGWIAETCQEAQKGSSDSVAFVRRM